MLQVWKYGQASLATLRARLEREDGAELVEYALVIGLIALVLFAALGFFATDISELYNAIGTKLGTAPLP